MLNIKQISFRNFRSYGKNNTTVNFEQPGTTLIVGKSDEGGTTNGHGKTSILYCLTWLLYDKVIDSINKDDLINNINKVDMWGSILFTANADTIQVERWRKSGRGNRENGVKLLINNVDVTPSSIDDTNKKLLDIIGIDFDLFSRIVVFSATNKSFFDLPTTSHYEANQTNMIEQLFDLQALSAKAQLLKGKIKEVDSELLIQERLIDQATKQIETHEQLIAKTTQKVTTWDATVADQLETIQQNIKLVEQVDFEKEKQHHETISEFTQIKRELSTELKTTDSKLVAATQLSKKLRAEAKSLEVNNCPYCNQHFAGSEEKLDHVLQEIDRCDGEREQLMTHVAELTEELEKIVEVIAATKQRLSVADFDHLVQLKSQHQELITQLAQLTQQINPHIETLEELIELKPTKPTFDVINELTNVNEHQQFLLKLLTKKDSFVRKALLHKNIPFLNDRLAFYLESLGLPHSVQFTPNLIASISQFGRELSFGCLSNGQKARVNFALSLAFGDVLQTIHRKINIQLFDEVLDIGLDNHGIVAASRVLKQKARDEKLSVFVISHRDEVQNTFDHTMTIKQIDGFSQIITT